jgi:hypothetical protein
MATNGIDRAFGTPLELVLLPPLYKSTITSARLYCLLVSVIHCKWQCRYRCPLHNKAIGHPFIHPSAAVPVVENSLYVTGADIILPIIDEATLIAVDFPVCDGPLATMVGQLVIDE